ncbi:alpha/beta hydrolase [Streptomyces sp. LHD-70]|uniref:alpha/beta fold hydrolase n=1 Tax=Streptomyces sp. LHD-70 TaxID=3072140 RepID=UPI00280C8213|nr:alpha/beta hydrolase [Streptomyces sp. LHD-70]MDQ8702845.1 alpha/beta hydrolase [Streptomyces sp. LHD-70]
MPAPTPHPEPRHRHVDGPAGPLHLVEQGTGPLVLLLHGFPESWSSWRHQLPALAAAGYRAVALDVRGYGRSTVPADPAAYRMLELVEDNAAVVRALGAQRAVLVGHDWGSPIAANTALARPDVCAGVGMLGVPYSPRGPMRPSEAFAGIGGDEEFYVRYFQEPGRAEAEIESDVRSWLAGFYAALSADTMAHDGPSPFFVPPGARMSERFPEAVLPAWLTEAELDARTAEFSLTGFTGALNRYRNADRDWEELAPWDGAPVTQPALYVAGALDASTRWLADAVAAFPETVPNLHAAHLLDGCGHWVQQERPADVNRLLVDWLDTLDLG